MLLTRLAFLRSARIPLKHCSLNLNHRYAAIMHRYAARYAPLCSRYAVIILFCLRKAVVMRARYLKENLVFGHVR